MPAESIADYTQRPLYTIGCGDLGTESYNVERVLNGSLALATKWKALVLVDEADVFMEERSNNELERNELVSGMTPNTSCPPTLTPPQCCCVSWSISKASCS